MNEGSHKNTTDDPFDILLQTALHERSSAQAREGLTRRMLARVEGERTFERFFPLWLWIAGPAMAVLLLVIMRTLPQPQRTPNYSASAQQLTHSGGVARLPKALAGVKETPSLGSTVQRPTQVSGTEEIVSTQGRRIMRTESKSLLTELASESVTPRLETFPSHNSTSDVPFGTGPAIPLPTASLQAAEQVELLRTKQALPLTIARLQIAPLTLPPGEQP